MQTNAKILTDISLTQQKEKLIRMHEVLNRTGSCRAWIYRLIKNSQFPKPVKIGERAIAFIENEVDFWIENTINVSRNKAA